METRILESIKACEAEILDFTKELVNIDSGVDCPEGVRACAELVAEKLRPLGFDIELIESEPVQLLATRPCEGAKKILHPHNGQFEYKTCQKSKRHSDQPSAKHIYHHDVLCSAAT
ncbi:MAG: hypothetical protein IIU54_05295, partial [Phascolarctobacterium sp.]|nr:hypothetical protein [Phascolarctobacterium sp.]